MIPLYSYPGSDWNNVIWAKQVNPNVPIVAIINPDGGPGTSLTISALTSYAKSLGMTMTAGNPGTKVPSSYIGTVTTIIIYEHSGVPSTSSLSPLGAYSKTNFAVVAYDVSSVDTAYLGSVAKCVGYVYLTNGVMPNPYAPESSYLDDLATALDSFDKTQADTYSHGTITVMAVNEEGQEIWDCTWSCGTTAR